MNFKIACKQKGLLVVDKTYNYLLLNGGKLQVDDDEEFLRMYVDHLGEQLFVVQMRTPVFKLFVDFDYEASYELSVIDCIELAKVFHQNVCILFAEKNTNDMIVCTASHSKLKKNKKIHTGLHFHWPNILVDSKNAKLIREHIISEITATFGDVFGDIFNMYDDSVYKSNGLRMKGSIKSYTDQRSYWPVTVIHPDLTTEPFSGNHLNAIVLTSIRSLATQPDTLCAELLNAAEKPLEIEKEVYSLQASKKWTSDDPLTLRCEEVILLNFPIYKETNFKVKDVLVGLFGETDKRYGKEMAIAHTNSTFCTNKNGNHQSSTVYFVFTKSDVVQRCFCHKEYNGKPCRSYKSPAKKMQVSSLHLFNPKPKNQTKRKAMDEDLLKFKM
jgi:hypothetical protein